MIWPRWCLTWAALLAIVLAPSSPAHADDELMRKIGGFTFDQRIQALLQEYGVPGAVVVVANPSSTVYLKGFGVRRLGAPGPVDGDTRFQIASMSKFVTATAIATLVDRRIVSWDAPVRTFSPGTMLAEPYATDNATLRDYLAHRTGLPAYAGDLLPALGYDTNDLVRRARFLAFGHSFRAEWAYSNYGIFLGQQAAAHAAGLTPSELLATAILQPLGMARSGPTRAELFKDDNHAAAHDIDGSVMPYEDVDAFSGAGAIVSTGADIGRWMQMLLARGMHDGHRVVAEATVQQIFAASMVQGPGGPLSDPNDAAGLGCESYDFLLGRVIEKNGALNGVRTIVTLIPDRGIGIAVFANKQLTVFPEAVRADFLERELGPSGRDLQAQIRAEQPGWAALVALPAPPSNATPRGHEVSAYLGRYTSELYGALVIQPARDGNGLMGAFGPNGYMGHLTPWSGDTFLLSFDNPDITRGLLTFDFEPGSASASALHGGTVPGALTVDYGRFTRAQEP
jgi:CubicO group peptidase (beta-lactamase class C family)